MPSLFFLGSRARIVAENHNQVFELETFVAQVCPFHHFPHTIISDGSMSPQLNDYLNNLNYLYGGCEYEGRSRCFHGALTIQIDGIVKLM